MAPLPVLLLLLLLPTSLAVPDEGFSILELDLINSHDYFPPPPPPPPPPPSMPSLTCASDLGGIGSLDDACKLVTSLQLDRDVYIQGTGSLVLLSGVSLACPSPACSISVNVSGELSLGAGASVVAGSLSVQAANVTLGDGAVINATALAGDPPPQTSGYPSGTDGAGGGHGGRGASCLKDQKKQQEDVWGGDAYSWSSLTQPWSYGSRGGTTSREEELGGGGGGRVSINVTDVLEVNGTVCADGGDGGLKGGGGSGGSIYLQALKM